MPRVAAPKTTPTTTSSTPAEPSVIVPDGLDVRSKMYVLLGALAGRVDFAADLLRLVALREIELATPRGE